MIYYKINFFRRKVVVATIVEPMWRTAGTGKRKMDAAIPHTEVRGY